MKTWSEFLKTTFKNGVANRWLQTSKSSKIHQKEPQKEVEMEPNRPKSDKKRVTKKGEKTKGPKNGCKRKSEQPTTLGGSHFGPRGGIKGGVNPSLIVGMFERDQKQPLNHLSPRGLVGLRQGSRESPADCKRFAMPADPVVRLRGFRRWTSTARCSVGLDWTGLGWAGLDQRG